jgi:uncharacterized damage-inducible protein DinB
MTKVLFVVPFAALSLLAQDNPLSSAVTTQFNMGKTNLVKAAEKMPEENYSYKPTDAVRSFGELIGHVANAQYMFCSSAAGEASPSKVNIEKDKHAKADLVQALKDAFAYCDKAYAGMTDANAAQKVKFFGREQPKLGVLTFNNMHNFEHYGNVVTYMRLKNLVPPSSESNR